LSPSARTGGTAQRLTTYEGLELLPKFSPDGATVAFTGEYDGNTDAYTIPATGGEPKRLTFHPGIDQVAEWYPDGKSILIRSARASNIGRYDRFFKVPAEGGFEEMLPLPTGGYASLSADGNLIAFVSPSYDRRTWKRYRGGNAPDIWVYDFKANKSQNVTADWAGPDEWPMLNGRTLYYCSDRNGRTANLWAYDLDKKTHRQVTTFTDYDIKWPSVGSDAIVFENGGWLYVLDLPGEKLHKISVLVPDDKPATRAAYRSVADWMGGMDLSPSAKRKSKTVPEILFVGWKERSCSEKFSVRWPARMHSTLFSKMETDAAGSAAKLTMTNKLTVKNKITHLYMQQKNARPAVKSKGACDDDR